MQVRFDHGSSVSFWVKLPEPAAEALELPYAESYRAVAPKNLAAALDTKAGSKL